MITAKRFYLILVLLLTCANLSFTQVTSSGSGNWADGTTWVGGVVPGTGANVIIGDGHKVVLNADATVNNLTINGTLEFENTAARSLIINGDISGDSLKTSSVTTGPLIHSITLYGNLTLLNLFDLRYGSNPNVGAANIEILGSSNSTLTGPANMDVNGVTINKSGGAKVILGSNFIQNNNSSNLPLGILNLTNGIIETGSFEWQVKATGSAADIQGGSNTSYINGTLVRFMSSGSSTRNYPIGDGVNYRPLTVYLATSVSNSGVRAYIVHGDANTGTSTFSGSIDKVSTVRYYVLQNISNNNLGYYAYAPSYGLDDGVSSGNTDLKVATSSDERATWNDRGTWGIHTTSLNNPPVFILSDSTAQRDTLSSQEKIYIALARATGTNTNPLPVELTGFSASVTDHNIILKWTTATEQNNKGFEVERSIDDKTFSSVGFVPGSGTTTINRKYSYTDPVPVSDNYYYRLKQIDLDGSFTYSQTINVTVELPDNYSLSQNYPNPFNPYTSIQYKIPESGLVTLKVYDVLGNEIKTLVNENQESGAYTVALDLSSLSSGTYIYELRVNSFTQRNKMILMK